MLVASCFRWSMAAQHQPLTHSSQPTYHILTLLGWLSRPVSLHFDRRPRACIRICYVLVLMRRPTPDTFTLACLDFNETKLERSLHSRPSRNLRDTDWEGSRCSHTLVKFHTPKDSQKDSFLVALIIALAQEDRRHAVQPLPPDSSFAAGLSCFTFSRQNY